MIDGNNPKLIYGFSIISIKISDGFFVKIYKLILKFLRKSKGLRTDRTILGKKIVGGVNISKLKAYHKTTVIKMFDNSIKIDTQINGTEFKVQK